MSEKLFREKCRENQIKITTQRFAIYKELCKSPDHPSADKIFRKISKRFPGISFDTVNRTLLTFSEIGLIRTIESYGNIRRFDPVLHPHHHLHCIKCHHIIDFKNKSYDVIKIPNNIPKRFSVFSKKVVLEGLCEKCKPQKGE